MIHSETRQRRTADGERKHENPKNPKKKEKKPCGVRARVWLIIQNRDRARRIYDALTNPIEGISLSALVRYLPPLTEEYTSPLETPPKKRDCLQQAPFGGHTHTHTHRGTQHSPWQSSYEHQPFLYHIISLPAAAVVSIVGGQEEGGRRDIRSKNVVCACAPISGGSWV